MSYLILFDVVLGGAFPLALPPQLLQVGLGALKRVLLHLVLCLVALEGCLRRHGDMILMDIAVDRRMDGWMDGWIER